MYPPVRLKKHAEDAVRKGMPWIYASDIIESSELMFLPPGILVSIETHKGQPIGTGYYNIRSKIACRVLALGHEPINNMFFESRIIKAMELRNAMINVPYYRMVHSEADGLPGLLVDRFDEDLVVQVGTAGMEVLQPLWLEALEKILKPRSIVFRNDSASRPLEGLAKEVYVFKGDVSDMVEVRENDCLYLADLLHGQKTGWFYDQRDNRKMIAKLAPGKTVIDIYCHSGGFGVLAAKEGAAHVTMVDSSLLALDLAWNAAQENDVLDQCAFVQGDAFEVMTRLQKENAQFDIVLADPPAFVKSKKDIAAGLKGYEKVARMATSLVSPDGLLFMASCSHHAGRSAFNKAVVDGITKAGRTATILKQTGAAADHPRHPMLAQNEYLKGILLQVAPA